MKNLDGFDLIDIIKEPELQSLEFTGKEKAGKDWLSWDYSCLGSKNGEECLSEMIIKKDSEELANTFVEDFIEFFKDNLEAAMKASEYIKKNTRIIK